MTFSPLQVLRFVLAIVFATLTAVKVMREHREHKSLEKTLYGALGIGVSVSALFIPLPGIPNVLAPASPEPSITATPTKIAANKMPPLQRQVKSPAPRETPSATPFPVSFAHTARLKYVATRLAEDMENLCNDSGDSSEATRRYATAFVVVAARLKARPEFKNDVLADLDLPVYGEPSCDDFRNGAKEMEDLAARLQ